MSSFYQIDSRIENELEQFKQEIADYQAGEITERVFKALRVPRGIYQQREEQNYMVRVRIAGGGITPPQAQTLAGLAEEFIEEEPHITTRQDIQLQGLPGVKNLPEIIDRLKEVNLTAIGGGGNTVRNITNCPFSGGCSNELLPAAPAAVKLTEELVPREDSYEMPRKYKISFSGCRRDCAYAAYTDMGFIPKNKNGTLGYEAYAGGGLGAHSATGVKVFDFIEPAEVPYVAEGIKQFFREHGNYEDKHQARLRFVKQKYGVDKFRRLCREYVEKQHSKEEMNFQLPDLPAERPAVKEETPAVEDDWFKANVRSDKNGYYSVLIPIPRGDLPPAYFRKLSALSREHADNNIYTAQSQNFILKGVPGDRLKQVKEELSEIKPAYGQPLSPVKARACKGAATCKLGLCHSPNLSRAIDEKLQKTPVSSDGKQLKLFISGCPNSCGHHPLAQLGFHGIIRRNDDRAVPCYQVVAAGRLDHNLAGEIGVVPGYEVPELVADFLRDYQAEDAKDFNTYFKNGGQDKLEELVEEYASIPPFTEDRNYYYDWYAQEQFSLEKVGEGECGAGVISLIESDLKEARSQLKKAEKDRGDLKEALIATARALLVTRGEDADDPAEIFRLFQQHFLKTELISPEYKDLVETARVSDQLSEVSPEQVRELLKEVTDLYEAMDSSFNFPGETEETGESPAEDSAGDFDREKDLRGVECPINYVKAKLEMEQLQAGEILKIMVDDGEPIENVPPSLREDGHTILKQEKVEDYYELLVKKGA